MLRTVLAILAVFVVSAVCNFVIHGVLLKATYVQYLRLLRTEADANQHFLYLLGAFLIFSIGFVLAYKSLTPTENWLASGLTAGAIVWLIASVSRYMTYFAIQPWPGSVVGLQIAYELPMSLMVGVVAGVILKA